MVKLFGVDAIPHVAFLTNKAEVQTALVGAVPKQIMTEEVTALVKVNPCVTTKGRLLLEPSPFSTFNLSYTTCLPGAFLPYICVLLRLSLLILLTAESSVDCHRKGYFVSFCVTSFCLISFLSFYLSIFCCLMVMVVCLLQNAPLPYEGYDAFEDRSHYPLADVGRSCSL